MLCDAAFLMLPREACATNLKPNCELKITKGNRISTIFSLSIHYNTLDW
jgi:hypothetical protein